MYLEDEYYYYRLAVDLAAEKGFDILHMDSFRKEIWLEQKIGRNAHVIRLAHHSFDWTNQLKQDTNLLLQKVQGLKKVVSGRKTIIHNVYVAKYPPVDDWEKLKQPISIRGGKQVELALYYLDQESRQEEKERLFSNLSKETPEFIYSLTESEMEQETIRLNQELQQMERRQIEEAESIFFYGKPLLVYLFLGINLLMFYLLEMNGGSTSPITLIEFGAKYNPLILEGEWWRIVTSMFLHVGFLHLFMNMLALFYLGTAVERIYGSFRFFFIYFLAGIAGGLTSFVFNTQVAAGASGAIFGLFGALLYFGVIHKKLFFRTMGWNLLFIIGLNIFIGATIPQIDNSAHMGGLIGGFLASGALSLPRTKKRIIQFLFLTVYAVAAILLWITGTSSQTAAPDAALQLQLASQYIEEENYKAAYEAADMGINESDRIPQAGLLFYRAYAAIQLDKIDEAIDDLEQVVGMEPSLAEAHYNLALLYLERDRVAEAAAEAAIAYQSNPENEQFRKLYDRLAESKVD